MPNIFRNQLRSGVMSAALMASIFSAGLFMLLPVPTYALYCANCATFYQQILQHAEQVNTALSVATQVRTQIQQYENMMAQAASLPDSLFSSITADLQHVANMYNRSLSLGRNISNLDTQFNTQFPGYQKYLQKLGQSSSKEKATDTMQDRYKKWSRQSMDNTKSALIAAGMNIGTFEDEDRRLNKMISRSKSAIGRMQAIQAGNEIAAQNVQQLQKLRDLIATQIQLQSNYMAQQQERASLDDALRTHRRGGEIRDTGSHKEY